MSLLGTDPKELEAGIWIDICMSVFTAALFTITKRQKQPVSNDRWIDKQNMV